MIMEILSILFSWLYFPDAIIKRSNMKKKKYKYPILAFSRLCNKINKLFSQKC